MRDDFAVFILSHGRAGRVCTYNALKKCGYSGKIYILVDNEDSQADMYKKEFGGQVIVFDKKKAAETTDAGNNFGKRNSVLFARNQNFVIAKEMGLKYFLQLDDDYSSFGFVVDENGEYATSDVRIADIDKVINACLSFLESSGAHSVAFGQGGDYIGGGDGGGFEKARDGVFLRKVMNSFFLSTERPFQFRGMMNDDVNTFVTLGQAGKLFATILSLRLWQKETQSGVGGLTDMYLEMGTYVKSFYTVMMAPSCTSIVEMGNTNKRLHHQISWKNAVPCIIDEKHKKREI